MIGCFLWLPVGGRPFEKDKSVSKSPFQLLFNVNSQLALAESYVTDACRAINTCNDVALPVPYNAADIRQGPHY